MKFKKSEIKEIIKEIISELKIVKFSADDMETLHSNGQVEKDGIFYQYRDDTDENVAPNHDGKAAPYGSGYKKAKKLSEAKRREIAIPVMDKLKVDKILKKLRLKPGKDYDIGYGSRNSFLLDIDTKYLDKVLTMLMKLRVRVR